MNVEQFATILEELIRSTDRSAYQISQESGVPYHRINRYIKGEMSYVTLEDAARLADYFNLDLNQLGAAAGVWVLPEQESEILSPPLTGALRETRELGRILEEELQDELAGDLMVIIGIWRRRIRAAQAEDREGVASRLPRWLRPRQLSQTQE